MSSMQYLYLLVPLAPLAGSIVVGLFGAKLGRSASHWLCCLGVGVSMVASYVIFRDVLAGHAFNGDLYVWMTSGGVKFAIGFLIDPLTALMITVVTFVSLMVHIYTIGYMADDPGYTRFFSYISLFTFSMLMLVMANNFLQLFFGWEAVGLVSYLLIGFWYTRPTAIYASLKAFLANRVGDFGFALGIGLIVAYSGSLDYATVFRDAPALAGTTFNLVGQSQASVLTAVCIGLFVGAMGKSAQVPLHVWLPDSMEGPTPISALIHAATMVTAGIFMVARMSPLFEFSETALSFVTIIGATTALFMAVLGVVQTDIKRVIAYSTLSQLGYMTVALGVSAYPAAIFHLMTHAFFKALLFLGAGSVIHAMGGEQDLRKLGGLAPKMVTTTITMAALNNGYTVQYVPVDYLKRTGSSKINPVRDSLNFLMLILRMTLLFRPLKIFIPTSIFFFSAAFFTWGFGVIVLHRLFDNLIAFEAECGVMALMLGMLADLINVRLRR